MLRPQSGSRRSLRNTKGALSVCPRLSSGGCAWEGPRHRPPPEGGWFICSGNRAIACQRTESESQSVLPERRSLDFEIRPRSPWPRHHELMMLRSLVSSETQGAKGKEGNSVKSDGTWPHTLAANALPPPSQQQPFWGAAAVVT